MRKIFDGKEAAKGVVFIKSHKDFDSVVEMVKHIRKKCNEQFPNLKYCFWDNSRETDIFRTAFQHFLEEMEEKNINLIVLRSLKEISSVPLEREAFLSAMKDNGVGVYLFGEGCFATVNYDYEC